MNLTLTQLRYLVAVARNGSVTAAARALNVSQPSISVAIDNVEVTLGQKLFVRQRGPSVSVHVRHETFQALGRRRGDAAIDLGLTYDLGLPAHFARILLHELRPHARLPASHALASRRTVSLAELAAYPLIMTDQ